MGVAEADTEVQRRFHPDPERAGNDHARRRVLVSVGVFNNTTGGPERFALTRNPAPG
jgi:hypothetical protein